MAKITVAKLFETVAEVDKRSQVALMQSEDSIQISEKTRTDLERLIATLRTDFTDIEQTQEIIRADKEEDNTITSSFFELQKSFDGLVGTVDILRTDLDNLYQAFYTSQIVRQEQLEKEEDAVFKEQDDLQKKRGGKKEGRGVLSNMMKGKKDPNQIQQDRKKQVKSLTKSVLRTLGLGALAGAAMGFGTGLSGGGYGATVTEQEGLSPTSLDASKIDIDSKEGRALVATVRELEGTADKSGYDTWFGGRNDVKMTEMTLQEVYDEQTRRLNAGETPKFRDAEGKVKTSAAVGIGQFLDPLTQAKTMYAARGEAFDPTKIKFDERLQNELILDLATRERGIDLKKPLTLADFEILQQEWASFGPYHKQTGRTLEETLRVYQQNLREAELGRFTTPDEPTKEEALRKVDETLKGFGGPGILESQEESNTSFNFFSDLNKDKSYTPSDFLRASYTSSEEGTDIASLQSNRSPSVSVVNLTQGMNGGTQIQQSRGAARSSVTALSNTTNSAPVSLMIRNTFLT